MNGRSIHPAAEYSVFEVCCEPIEDDVVVFNLVEDAARDYFAGYYTDVVEDMTHIEITSAVSGQTFFHVLKDFYQWLQENTLNSSIVVTHWYVGNK